MNWYLNLKTAAKLICAFAVVCALTAVVGMVGVSRLAAVNDLLATMYERDLRGLSDLKDANVALVTVGRETRRATSVGEVAEIQRMAQEMEKQAEAFHASFAAAEKNLVTDEAKALASEVRSAFPLYHEGCRNCVEAALRHDPAAVQAALKSAKGHADKVDAALRKLCDSKERLAAAANECGEETYARARNEMVAVVVSAVVIAMLLGILIARVIVRPLNRAVGVLDAVADGDLTVTLEVDTKDEVGQMGRALNRAVESVRRTLTEVQGVAFGVSGAAAELSSASTQLASGAQEQASSLEETAASLEEITSTIKNNADNAQQASQLASGSREVAERGGQIVGRAVGAMREINESSRKIGDIITTIDELAFQTNLLALNAAVEAARAGEQGRGFAVVAAEVRNLARRSATAAKEIKAMIQDSMRNVESGTELVTQSGHALTEIVTSVKRVTDIVAEIAAASREQSAGIDQVTVAVTQMDHVTQANAAQTEELSSTAESLASQATQLQAQVARFRLGSEQQPSAPTAAVSRATVRPVPAPSRPKPARRSAAGPGATPTTSSRPAAPMPVATVAPPETTRGAAGSEDGFEDF